MGTEPNKQAKPAEAISDKMTGKISCPLDAVVRPMMRFRDERHSTRFTF